MLSLSKHAPRRSNTQSTKKIVQKVAEHHGAPSWLLRCATGLAKILITELRFNGLVDRRTKPTILWQRNHDLVFLPRLQREPRPADLRIAEDIQRCPIYGRYKISNRQLDVLAAVHMRGILVQAGGIEGRGVVPDAPGRTEGGGGCLFGPRHVTGP